MFSVGILYLAATAGLLLIAFGGITDRLIPLFAIGAFLTFTLSQAGMVVHWLREARDGSKGAHARSSFRLGVNGLGTLTTSIALAVIVTAKFLEGAWITVLTIPLVILLLKSIRSYYDRIESRVQSQGALDLSRSESPIVLVATHGRDRLTDKALHFAVRLSPDVIAVHLTDLDGEEDPQHVKALRDRWKRDVEGLARRSGAPVPRLMMLKASFRRIHAPLLKLIERISGEHPDRTIAVLVPLLAKPHWWQYLLHTRHAAKLSNALMKFGGDKIVVINVPFHVEKASIKEGLIEEERPGEAAPQATLVSAESRAGAGAFGRT